MCIWLEATSVGVCVCVCACVRACMRVCVCVWLKYLQETLTPRLHSVTPNALTEQSAMSVSTPEHLTPNTGSLDKSL